MREICAEVTMQADIRWQTSVIAVIQEIVEAFLVSKFEDKLYYFSLIIRLIANIYNIEFIICEIIRWIKYNAMMRLLNSEIIKFESWNIEYNKIIMKFNNIEY